MSIAHVNRHSYENTLNNIIEITKYSSMNQVIVITDCVLWFINNLKLSVKNEGLCEDDILQVNEYNESLKLWI